MAGVDQLWFANTSIPADVLFEDFTAAVLS
jgi:hypothetical protein